MFKKTAILCLVSILAGCGTAQTIVMEPIENRTAVSGVSVISDSHNVDVPAKIVQQLQEKIEKGLYEKNGYDRSEELKIVFKFLQQDKGNQFSRWFWGGIGNTGEASLTVLVKYLDADGNELGKTQVQGRIDSGFFGGSFGEAITKAAEQVVRFTVANFPSSS